MARNRKRARDRRPRLPEGAHVGARPAAVGADEMADGQEPGSVGGAPTPLAHATPDSELADAQLALGRPELAEVPGAAELEEFEESEAAADAERAGLAPQRRAQVVEGPSNLGARFVGFLRGSWLELQRVQWPDRRQVMQATGVVLGFVIVAGVFLGVADLVASKLVNLIIK